MLCREEGTSLSHRWSRETLQCAVAVAEQQGAELQLRSPRALLNAGQALLPAHRSNLHLEPLGQRLPSMGVCMEGQLQARAKLEVSKQKRMPR